MEMNEDFKLVCYILAAAVLRLYGAEVDSALKTQKTSL